MRSALTLLTLLTLLVSFSLCGLGCKDDRRAPMDGGGEVSPEGGVDAGVDLDAGPLAEEPATRIFLVAMHSVPDAEIGQVVALETGPEGAEPWRTLSRVRTPGSRGGVAMLPDGRGLATMMVPGATGDHLAYALWEPGTSWGEARPVDEVDTAEISGPLVGQSGVYVARFEDDPAAPAMVGTFDPSTGGWGSWEPTSLMRSSSIGTLQLAETDRLHLVSHRWAEDSYRWTARAGGAWSAPTDLFPPLVGSPLGPIVLAARPSYGDVVTVNVTRDGRGYEFLTFGRLTTGREGPGFYPYREEYGLVAEPMNSLACVANPSGYVVCAWLGVGGEVMRGFFDPDLQGFRYWEPGAIVPRGWVGEGDTLAVISREHHFDRFIDLQVDIVWLHRDTREIMWFRFSVNPETGSGLDFGTSVVDSTVPWDSIYLTSGTQ